MTLKGLETGTACYKLDPSGLVESNSLNMD